MRKVPGLQIVNVSSAEVGVKVGASTGVAVKVDVGVGVSVDVSVGVGIGVPVGVSVGTGVAVGVLVGIGVLVGVLVGVAVLVGVLVGMGVFVGVFVGIGVFVGVFVGIGVFVGVAVALQPRSGWHGVDVAAATCTRFGGRSGLRAPAPSGAPINAAKPSIARQSKMPTLRMSLPRSHFRMQVSIDRESIVPADALLHAV